MELIINIILVLVFIILLIMAIVILIGNYICDNHTCRPFLLALDQPTEKEQILFLIDILSEDGMWMLPYLASAILSGLFFGILPITLTVKAFALVFLLSFIVFYCILAFFIHHYIKPMKLYIKDYVDKKNDA